MGLFGLSGLKGPLYGLVGAPAGDQFAAWDWCWCFCWISLARCCCWAAICFSCSAGESSDVGGTGTPPPVPPDPGPPPVTGVDVTGPTPGPAFIINPFPGLEAWVWAWVGVCGERATQLAGDPDGIPTAGDCCKGCWVVSHWQQLQTEDQRKMVAPEVTPWASVHSAVAVYCWVP